MLELLSNIITFNDISVISVYKSNECTRYYVLRVKRAKNRLEVISTAIFTNLDELMELKSKPVLLLIDGIGVVNKKINEDNESDIDWQKSIDYNSIHYTSYSVEKENFLSFTRRNSSDEIINEFQKKGFRILDFYVGPIPALLLKSSLQLAKIKSNESVLLFEGDNLEQVVRDTDMTPVMYTIGDSEISNFHLPLYGIAINHCLKSPLLAKSNSDKINREEIIYQEAFTKFGISMLVGFFILLLASYIATQYVGTRNIDLAQQSVFSQQSYQDAVALENKRDQKLQILADTGLLSNRFLSSFPYELIETAPMSIKLATLNVFPVDDDIKQSKKVVLNSGDIFISGSVYDESEFNRWIEKAKKASWIQQFEIVSFSKDKKNVSQFEIKITTK